MSSLKHESQLLKSRQVRLEYLALLEEKARRKARRRFYDLFPDEGELRRELYKKHLEFFRAGAEHDERCFMAGNRVGKTEGAGYETVCHATGLYPNWWEGHRFDRPINGLLSGDTGITTRDIIQRKLCGKWDDLGTGLIPGDNLIIEQCTRKQGIPEAYESIAVRHVSGGVSTLKLRSYEQGRKIFQGTEEDWIWFDEECPLDVYEEALIRTMTTNGLTVLTFTPLSGLTELVMSFLESVGKL